MQGQPRPASDQYALGVIVYEWLTGAPPFQGSSFPEIARQHLFAAPTPLRERVPTLSADVERVVLTALAKDPLQRFATVQDFADALEEASEGAGVGFALPSTGASFGAVRSEVWRSLNGRRDVPEGVRDEVARSEPDPASLRTLDGSTLAVSQPAIPSPAAPAPTPLSERRFTRRTLLGVGGLVGLAAVVGGTGLTALAERAAPAPQQAPLAHPTLPLGTRIYTYRRHQGEVKVVAWSPDGKRLASGSFDTTAQVWDATTGDHVLVYRGHTHEVKTIASASEDKTVQVWHATTGETLLTYRGHTNKVIGVAWSPDGTRLASASFDGTVQLWNATTGKSLYTYTGHTNQVWAVSWSPDGQWIASGSVDGTVQVWKATI